MAATWQHVGSFTRTALLGVRFWDEVTRTPVQDGLEVTLRDPANPYCRLMAVPNRSGVHVVHDAPGLHSCARAAGGEDFWRNPPEHADLILEVSDQRGYFQPLEIPVRLPVEKFFTPECPRASPPEISVAPIGAAAGYIPLFSTSTRRAPGGMAVVRADLKTWDGQQPVSWGMLTVEYSGEVLGRGVADRDGKVAVIFPYPEPESLRRGSPPEISTPPGWELVLRINHAAAMIGLERPELCALLMQPRARLVDGLSPPAELGAVALTLGSELIVRSTGSSSVFVAAA